MNVFRLCNSDCACIVTLLRQGVEQPCLPFPLLLVLVAQSQLLLHSLDFVDITSVLRLALGESVGANPLTFPASSESLTQFLPLILFNLITILSGFETVVGFEAFWKSFDRNVPIPNEAMISSLMPPRTVQLTSDTQVVAAFLQC